MQKSSDVLNKPRLSLAQAQQLLESPLELTRSTSHTPRVGMPRTTQEALRQVVRVSQQALETFEHDCLPQSQTHLENTLADLLLAMTCFGIDADQALERAVWRKTKGSEHNIPKPRLLLFWDRAELWFQGVEQGRWPINDSADREAVVELTQSLGYELIDCDIRQLDLFSL